MVVFVSIGELAKSDAMMVRTLVNDLVERGVEARLAVSGGIGGPHLTAPCIGEPRVVEILKPDVVVGLDARSLERVAQWTARPRYTVLAQWSARRDVGIDLLPWGHDRSDGLRRARIGSGAAVADVADLVHRLAGGPPPGPPSDDVANAPYQPPAGSGWSGPGDHGRQVVLVGAPDRQDRFHRLARHLRQAGHRASVVVTQADRDPDVMAWSGADLVVLDAGLGRRARSLSAQASELGVAAAVDVAEMAELAAMTDRAGAVGVAATARSVTSDTATERLSIVTEQAGVVERALALGHRALLVPSRPPDGGELGNSDDARLEWLRWQAWWGPDAVVARTNRLIGWALRAPVRPETIPVAADRLDRLAVDTESRSAHSDDLELALADRDRTRPLVLHVVHGSLEVIGGTEKSVTMTIDAMRQYADFAVLFPTDTGFTLQCDWTRSRSTTGQASPVDVTLPVLAHPDRPAAGTAIAHALELVLRVLTPDVLHINNFIHDKVEMFRVLDDFEGKVVCSVRDLSLACPNYWLLYRNATPCGIPSDQRFCERCLPETRQLTISDLDQLRVRARRGLRRVDQWVFSTRSALDQFLHAYEIDTSKVSVVDHGAIIDCTRRWEPDEARIRDEPLRVGFVGRGWVKKGLALVNAVTEELLDDPIEMHHFGEVRQRASRALVKHGKYDNRVLPEVLHRCGIQVVLIPGPYAETYCHTLTEVWIAGLPVIGNRYGAVGERLRATGAGWLVDPDDVGTISSLIRALDGDREEILRTTRVAAAVTVTSMAETARQLAAIYGIGT